MDAYSNTGIKDIIAEFPEVGTILEAYGIGCGPCTVGICLLKDILDIHKMAPEKEQELMAAIEGVIYSGLSTKEVIPARTVREPEDSHVFSRPMQVLVDEHVQIKRFLKTIPSLAEQLEPDDASCGGLMGEAIDLIRSYADKSHHGKEEDILFSYFDTTKKIFQVICEDHRTARAYASEMQGALERNDWSSLGSLLLDYAGLLAEHIEKEDGILFPWLDRKLSADQRAELAARFAREDACNGVDHAVYESFLERLEERFGLS